MVKEDGEFIEAGRQSFSVTLALNFSRSDLKYIALTIFVSERLGVLHLKKFGPKL